jgi:hypothetical protein
MTLPSWLSPKRAVKVHAPSQVLQYPLPPRAVVQLAEGGEARKEGERLEKDVGEPGVGFAEGVAGDGTVWVDEG